MEFKPSTDDDALDKMFSDRNKTVLMNFDYSPPRKVVVETNQMYASGTKGGMPMFSRSGIRSTLGELTFQPDELKGSEGVPPTFPKELFHKKDSKAKRTDYQRAIGEGDAI